MTKLYATKESVEKAKKVYKENWYITGGNPEIRAFDLALDALFEPELEGWVLLAVGPNNNGFMLFEKGIFTLYCRPYSYWQLRKAGTPIAYENSTLPISEAQAWADRVIAEREADNKPEPWFEELKMAVENHLKTATKEQILGELKSAGWKEPQPRPFGPGSRYRMPNGDILLVIKAYVSWAVINLTANNIFPINTPATLDDLQAILTKVGAVPLEDQP